MVSTTNDPLYKVLIHDLRVAIDQGKYNVGDLLPSENDLSGQYNTTRATVRQALRELTVMGYITRRHGKGSIVCEPRKGLGILSIRGVTAAVGNKSLQTKILKKQQAMNWPLDFFFELDEKETSAGCIFFSRLRFVSRQPIVYEETFISNRNLDRFTTIPLENRSLFNTLHDHYKIEIKEGEQMIWAVGCDKNISKLLKIYQGSPVLHMKRKLKTNLPDINVYSSLYCNTDQFHLHDYF